MLDHSVFDVHLVYAASTLGALGVLRAAVGLAAVRRGESACSGADRAQHAAELERAVQDYALALEVFAHPPIVEREAQEATLAQQFSRIRELQRRVLPEFAEHSAQLQAAHGRLMDFLWHERLLCIRQDQHVRLQPAAFDALRRAVRAPLQELAQGCGKLVTAGAGACPPAHA